MTNETYAPASAGSIPCACTTATRSDCAKCRRSPSGESGPSVRVIQVARDGDLLSYDFLMAVADRINDLDLSREKTTAWLVATIYSWIVDKEGNIIGQIVDGEGDIIEIYDEIFDDAYGRDASFCWNTNVKQFSHRRPQRLPAERMLLRFQLWDAAFKIAGKPIVLPTY